ncbi:hypothetical protein QQF64_021942 [Cirrhinus molitorella]|uniref:Uncharacterized protein n=1 Tax=Cirrhinus molitorella TaxID=172907 RepID=A0ABR3LA89_9TELE
MFLWHNGCRLMAPKCHACLLRHVWNCCSLGALCLAMNGKFCRRLINNPMKRSNSVAIFIKCPVQFCGTRSTRAPNIHRRAAVLQAGRGFVGNEELVRVRAAVQQKEPEEQEAGEGEKSTTQLEWQLLAGNA